MKRVDIMKRAGRNLRQAKGRTILTSLAIAVGAFTLTMALAAGQGTRNYADNLLKNNIDPQAMFVVKDKSLFGEGGTVGLREYDPDIGMSSGRPGATLKQMNDQDVAYLKSRSDLEQIVPIYTLSPKWIGFEGKDKKYIGAIDYYDATILSDTKAGSLPALGQQIADNEIVVPQKYAETLGIDSEKLLGKQVVVTFAQQAVNVSEAQIQAAFAQGGTDAVQRLVKPKEVDFTYTVRAVTKTSTMSLGATPKLFVSANSAKQINDFQTEGTSGAGKYMGVSMLVKKGSNPEVIKAELEKKQYYSQTAKDAQGLLFTIVNTLQGIVTGFGLLALFASVFGIINTQYISVLERTSQIGLMKALGMPRRAIAKLFRYEAAWIGFLGGALGALVAYSVGTLANPAISKWLDIGDNRILEFVWWQILLLMLALILIAVVAGWFPARKAARLDPIEALRTE
ncbi:ABC transporter permease [Candidatus Saccharibacteria bacterium]|nr:MAG: ABC transporter permease [Candidatus Saccharibacteria bacterium]